MAPERMLRKRLHLKGELMLALLPTLLILGVLALVEALSHQRLLFASLASSAFLIYLTLFGMAVAITGALVVLRRAAVWMLTRYTHR